MPATIAYNSKHWQLARAKDVENPREELVMVTQTARKQAETADQKLVRLIEEDTVLKILEKLEAILPDVVREAVHESIVRMVHNEPQVVPKAPEGAAPPNSKVPNGNGLCAQVWLELDKLRTKKKVPPTLKDILTVSEKKGWNENNTRVEYYAWRRHHGIKGRLPN